MNRLIAIFLSCILIINCTACVSSASSLNNNQNAPSTSTDHNEQLLHDEAISSSPAKDESLTETNTVEETVPPQEPDTPEDTQLPADSGADSEPAEPEPSEPDPSLPSPAVRTIDPSKPMVALTFDDGPNAAYSDKILDILEKNGAVATFFEVGKNVANCPQPLTRMVELGCEIGSHSNVHKDLSKLSATALANDLAAADEAFINAVGFAPTLLRPPYGAVNKTVKYDTGRSVITWTIDTEDWKSQDTAKIVSYVKSLPSLDGEIVLLHSSYQTTVDAVDILIPWLIQEGYQLVTVSELMAYYYGELMQPGQFYGYTYFTTHGKTDSPLSLPGEPAADEDAAPTEPQPETQPQLPETEAPLPDTPQPSQPETPAAEQPAETPSDLSSSEQPADDTLPDPEKPLAPISPDAPMYSTFPEETISEVQPAA